MTHPEPIVRWTKEGRARILVHDFDWDGVIVHAGFETDGTSIPQIFWSWEHPFGRIFPASLIHDCRYTYHKTTRKFADNELYDNILKLDVRQSKAYTVWAMVRRFGGGSHWKRKEIVK